MDSKPGQFGQLSIHGQAPLGEPAPQHTMDSGGAIGNRRYHAMVKPGGSTCNLDCAYCYYLHKEQLLEQKSPRMDDDTLEEYIRQYISSQDGEEIIFSWQGGEPTLLGLGFFEKIVRLQAKYKPAEQRIENDLQTNGTLLNDEWCRFLNKHGFLVGLSIDGPRDMHDAYRVTKGGEPTFDAVFGAVKLLRRHQVKFNALCVVNRLNAQHPLETYRFLSREVRPDRIQFIGCVEPKVYEQCAPQQWDADSLPMLGSVRARPGTPDSIVTDWTVDPDDWGAFLSTIFDEWHERDIGRVFVDQFENAVAMWMGLDAQMCVFGEICGKGVAVEHNGDVFSCDHYVYPEYRLGNIHDGAISDMVFSSRQAAFGFAKRDTLPAWCRECDVRFACNGECPRNRLLKSPDGEPGVNFLCTGYKRFFTHIDNRMKALVVRIRAGEDLRVKPRPKSVARRRRKSR